jgi:hypothetical protein
MLQELGYEKQQEYFGTQVTFEGSVSVWHIQVYIFTPKPLRGVYEVEKIPPVWHIKMFFQRWDL